MRRFVMSKISVILFLSMFAAGGAEAAVIDFEGFNLGGQTFISVGSPLVFDDVDGSGVDVSFEAGSGNNRIYDLFLFGGDPNATGQALIDFAFPTGSNQAGTMILFSSDIQFFSLVAGDFGGEDDDFLMITAFNSNDEIIATDSVSWGKDVTAPFAELSISGVRISKILYQSGGPFAGSSFIDDVTFTPVPEPTSALLLGFGLAGIAGTRRRAARR